MQGFNNEKTSIMAGLPAIFDLAETQSDWSKPLAAIELMAKEGVGALPDWLAVEIIWMRVQFEQQLLRPNRPEQQKASLESAVAALETLPWRQRLIGFDRDFPLLDSLKWTPKSRQKTL